MRIKETEEREAIWVKNRCKFQADDEREDELADDEVENRDENQARETMSFQADNWVSFQVSQADEADEIDEADEVNEANEVE